MTTLPSYYTTQNKKITPGKVEIITGWKMKYMELKIRLHILALIYSHHRSTRTILHIAKKLDSTRRVVLGEFPIRKLVKKDNQYRWDLYTPGFPSKAFDEFILSEINRIVPIRAKTNTFTNVFFAITKKCGLKCEHCFEWDVLNKPEKLGKSELKKIQAKIEKAGTSQIQLTGGEPMLRVEEIISLLRTKSTKTEYWLLTSGHKLTREKAEQLYTSGLTGVMVSLDHHEPSRHNNFRGNAYSFHWAEQAVRASLEAGIITGLSLCVTKSYATTENLHSYLALAKSWGVGFIQLLEPKAVGHYLGKDVVLSPQETKLLEEFYLKVNYSKKHSDDPLICYHGYHQRKAGCFASGNRNLYVDTDGFINACPFCKTQTGSILEEGLETTLNRLNAKGCSTYGKPTI